MIVAGATERQHIQAFLSLKTCCSSAWTLTFESEPSSTTTTTILIIHHRKEYQSLYSYAIARRRGRARPTRPYNKTASQAGPSSGSRNLSTITHGPASASVPVPSNPRLPSPTHQPPYPSPSPIPTSSAGPEVRVTTPTRWSLRSPFITAPRPEFATPFRSRAGTGGSSASRPRQTSAARLWNPTNSTPRDLKTQQKPGRTHERKQEKSEDPNVIAIPLSHPAIASRRGEGDAPGEYPLLTLPEQRQIRNSGSIRASLQVERSGSSNGSNRISLPRTVSIEISRRKSSEASPSAGPRLDKGKGKAVDLDLERYKTREGKNVTWQGDDSFAHLGPVSGLSFEKGKGKANMSTELERGPPTNPYSPGGVSNLPHNRSNPSLRSGIGAALSSSGTSIIGSDGPAQNPGEDWGPQHPCFPHLNPHVPLSSPLYQTTRIIRIRRDWMLQGDLAPTFSNLYPEILDPAGVSEQEFRIIIERINAELVPAFDPWAPRNMLDATLGLLTGWIWDDLGFTGAKSRLLRVEQYLENWNRDMERKSKDMAGGAPQIVSLRRTGYMNLDIQVPDPEVSYPISERADDRTDTGLSQQMSRQITRP